MEKQKVKLLCSYGGKIQPRPSDRQLTYIGGDTKILAVDRHVKFSDFSNKLNSLCKIENSEVSIKYQLPGEDLDALVSLIDDDDVEHMMLECDRMQRISPKPTKLRLFVFDVSTPPKNPGPGQDPNPDYLFGFDKEYQPSIGPPVDLLQISPRDGFGLISEGHVTGGGSIGNMIGVPAPVVYRVPVGGEYFSGQYAYGVVTGVGVGNREQPVYGFVPVTPPVQEQAVKSLKG